ncbi:hypothetical protein Jiend_32870 [Micromonospora endophytica]|nr:hypothetical protein Jiend_32870 [Micromonospora endophytica]
MPDGAAVALIGPVIIPPAKTAPQAVRAALRINVVMIVAFQIGKRRDTREGWWASASGRTAAAAQAAAAVTPGTTTLTTRACHGKR